MEEVAITFQGIFSKATTLVDGGWRITFDLDQTEAHKIHLLHQFREKLIQIACIPIEIQKFEEENYV